MLALPTREQDTDSTMDYDITLTIYLVIVDRCQDQRRGNRGSPASRKSSDGGKGWLQRLSASLASIVQEIKWVNRSIYNDAMLIRVRYEHFSLTVLS